MRDAVQLPHAAVEEVRVGLAADAVHLGVGGVLPERPAVPGVAEGGRAADVAGAPEAVVPEPLAVVHVVRPEVGVAVDHRAPVGQVGDRAQPAVGPGDEPVWPQPAGDLEVEGRRQHGAAVAVPGDADELVRLPLRRVVPGVGAGEVVRAADQAGAPAAAPVPVEVGVVVALALGGLDEHEVVAGLANRVPGDRSAARVLPARDVGADDPGRGGGSERYGEDDGERGNDDCAQGIAQRPDGGQGGLRRGPAADGLVDVSAGVPGARSAVSQDSPGWGRSNDG